MFLAGMALMDEVTWMDVMTMLYGSRFEEKKRFSFGS
jgi:hypothetical protein